jgi:hypothetical protein
MTKFHIEIGGNNPPADAAFTIHVDDLFSLLSATLAGGEVDDDAKEAAIDGLMDDFRKASKDADKARAEEKKPHDEAGKLVQAKWKPIIDKADCGVSACKDALTPYRAAKLKAAQETERKAREEAAAKEKAAQEALRQSDDLEARFDAEQKLEEAKKLTAIANRVAKAPTGLRTYWEAEITDKGAALRAYLKSHPDEFLSLIQTLAERDARGIRPAVPGVIYHERKKAA